VHRAAETGLNRRQYICQYCEKHFTGAQQLRQHEAIHTGDTRFACTQCDRRFFRRDKLKIHMQSHKVNECRDIRYACMQCDKSFTAKHNLKDHEATHKQSNGLDDLTSHVRQQSSPVRTECQPSPVRHKRQPCPVVTDDPPPSLCRPIATLPPPTGILSITAPVPDHYSAANLRISSGTTSTMVAVHSSSTGLENNEAFRPPSPSLSTSSCVQLSDRASIESFQQPLTDGAVDQHLWSVGRNLSFDQMVSDSTDPATLQSVVPNSPLILTTSPSSASRMLKNCSKFVQSLQGLFSPEAAATINVQSQEMISRPKTVKSQETISRPKTVQIQEIVSRPKTVQSQEIMSRSRTLQSQEIMSKSKTVQLQETMSKSQAVQSLKIISRSKTDQSQVIISRSKTSQAVVQAVQQSGSTPEAVNKNSIWTDDDNQTYTCCMCSSCCMRDLQGL